MAIFNSYVSLPEGIIQFHQKWPSTYRASHGREETVWLLATYLIVQPHLWKGSTCVLYQSMSVSPSCSISISHPIPPLDGLISSKIFTGNEFPPFKGVPTNLTVIVSIPLKIATLWRLPYFEINPHHIVIVGCVSHYILPSTYQHYDTVSQWYPGYPHKLTSQMSVWLYICPDIVDALSHSPVPYGWNYIHLCPNFEFVMVGFTMIDPILGWLNYVCLTTIWLFNIAMENPLQMVVLMGKSSINGPSIPWLC